MPGTTKSRGSKDALDKFYTRPEVAARCLGALDLPSFSRIIEPSAGGGAFSDLLFADSRLNSVLALDLAPEAAGVVRQDWFDFTDRVPGRTLVVGNPPFGRQHSLALRFIDHAFAQVGADTVAFVLPRGFRKESVQDRVYRRARLVTEVELAPDSFTLHGAGYNLPAVFQVWRRTRSVRPLSQAPMDSAFATFTRKQAAHDVVVRRVGGRAGTAFLPVVPAAETSNYFLQLSQPSRPPATEVVKLINGLDFQEARNGTGPNSLSKREFVRHFDQAYRERFCVA